MKDPLLNATTTNDNETYTSLGFQTLLILNRLRTTLELSELTKQQEEDRERQTASNGADKERSEDNRHDVDQLLNKGRSICASQVWGDPERSRARTK